jgi:hypothetical protein
MMFFVYPKNHEMRRSFLIGSAALLFLLALSQMVSFLLKNPEGRHHSFERKKEGAVTFELVVNKQDQGVYYIAGGHTVEGFLFQINPDWGRGHKTIIANGMSIRIEQGCVTVIDEMAPHKKLALGIPVNINQLSPEEIMLIPGIGEKTAQAIYSYIRDHGGCIRNLSELSDIPGIKERKIAAMRKYFIAKPDTWGRFAPRT